MYYYYLPSDSLHYRIIRFKTYKYNCPYAVLFFLEGNKEVILEEPYTDEDFKRAVGIIYKDK